MDKPVLDSKSQAACAAAGLVGVVTILIGLIVAKYLPPPDADWSPERFAEFYRDNADRTRTGILLLILAMCGWATLIAVVWVQLRRGGAATMAALHLVAGAATYVFLTLFATLCAAAAFRAERAPEDVQLLHDIGWFMAFLAAPPFVLQAAAVGFAVLTDRADHPVYPRWLGYVGLWVGLLLLPGTILLYFKTGPFAYDGLISYWIPVFAFGGWMAILSLCALLAARQPARAPHDVGA